VGLLLSCVYLLFVYNNVGGSNSPALLFACGRGGRAGRRGELCSPAFLTGKITVLCGIVNNYNFKLF